MAKGLFLSTMILILSGSAHAVVTDSILCQLEVSDLTGKKTWKQDLSFTAVRLPQTEYSGIHFTGADASTNIEIKDAVGTTHVNALVYYNHAFKTDLEGKAIAARQHVCFTLDGSWCPHPKTNPDGSTTGTCSMVSSMCAVWGDPFGEHGGPGWPETGIAPDGTPIFNESLLIPHTAMINGPDGRAHGKMRIGCAFKGTYQ